MNTNIYWDKNCWVLSIYGKKHVYRVRKRIEEIMKNNILSINLIRGLFDSEGSFYNLYRS